MIVWNQFFKILLPAMLLSAHIQAFGNPDPDDRYRRFIDKILPAIRQVNSEVLQQREGIYNLFIQFKNGQALPEEETMIIYRYLKFYRCKVPADTAGFVVKEEHFKQLLKKVDVIPVKLVLAQSALESNWGNSRFAKEGNNYFGIRCHTSGCGLDPKKVDDGSFMVKAYPGLIDGMRDYFRLLNASVYYESFRDLRMVNRLNGDFPKPEEIVYGLENFSSLRDKYIQSLLVIMNANFKHF
jgi:Bax protein